MIHMPRRSVTRFFIPLLDVMTLLFCIFLLMPLVGDATQAEVGAAGPTPVARDDAWAGLLEREREELQRLQNEQMETLQRRLDIQVLEIDADTGKLYWHDGEDRLEIGSQAQARALIEQHRREAGGRELYYLFLFPRRLTGYPQQQQIRQYQRWFESVAHGIDNPRGARRGQQP
jgi:hypothetical protein